VPGRQGDADYSLNLEFLLLHSRFHPFTNFRDFISILIEFFFLLMEKIVGSGCLDPVFVHQSLDLSTGLHAPISNEGDSYTAGPFSQIK